MPDRLMFYYTVATSPFLLYLSGNISQWSNSRPSLVDGQWVHIVSKWRWKSFRNVCPNSRRDSKFSHLATTHSSGCKTGAFKLSSVSSESAFLFITVRGLKLVSMSDQHSQLQGFGQRQS